MRIDGDETVESGDLRIFGWPKNVVPSTDLTATRWLQDSMQWLPWNPGPSIARSLVPLGYTHYLRLNHPAWWRPISTVDRQTGNIPGRRVRWSEVAKRANKRMDTITFFVDIVPEDAVVANDLPFTERPSGLSAEVIRELVPILQGLTATPERVWMSFWEGDGIWNGSKTVFASSSTAEPREHVEVHPDFRTLVHKLPRWSPPNWERFGRRYWLAVGSLAEVITLATGFPKVEPNFLWPEDHAWFFSQEIDLDFAVIGTTEEGVDWLGGAPTLEVYEI